MHLTPTQVAVLGYITKHKTATISQLAHELFYQCNYVQRVALSLVKQGMVSRYFEKRGRAWTAVYVDTTVYPPQSPVYAQVWVYQCIEQNPNSSNVDIASELDLPLKSVGRITRNLAKQGVLERKYHIEGKRHYYRYSVPSQSRKSPCSAK